MRHHRRGKPRQRLERFALCPTWRILRRFNGIGKFIESRDRDIEGEGLQSLGHGCNGAMCGAPQSLAGFFRRAARLRQAGQGRFHNAKHALREAISAGHARFRPFHIAFGWIVGKDEPARRIGAVFGDDRAGVHRIALGFGHGLNPANRHGFGAALQGRAARAIGANGEVNFFRVEPAAIRTLIAFMLDHALREQPSEGFIHGKVAGFLHGAREEARIEQMQNCVFNAANILINRQPAIHGALDHRLRRAGRAEARVIPG